MNNTNANSPRANGIISHQELQQLVDIAPDMESLLTIKFCFQLYTWRSELCSLNVGHDFICDETGCLVQFIIGNRTPSRQRCIEIDASSAKILAVLLPKSGRAFLDSNPFERLKRFAKGFGIGLTSQLARRSCISYSRDAGMSESEVACRMGLSTWPFRRPKFLPAGRRQLAGEYFNLNFNVDRIRALPRHSGPLKAVMVRNQEEAV